MSAMDDLKTMAVKMIGEVGEAAGVGGIKDALSEIEEAGRKNRVDAVVTSAVELTDSERQTLESRLRAKHGDDLPIDYRVDPAILGGLMVRVGDKLVDGSVASRLSQLRRSVRG